MSEYVKNRILEGEHQHQDFKFQITDAAKIARSLSAFANTGGGRLLVGVKDNGNIAGVRSDEEYHMVEAAAQMHCKPIIPFDHKIWNVDGKAVMEVVVKKSHGQLVKAPDKNGQFKAFLRKDDENILANGVFVLAHTMQFQMAGITLEYSSAEKELMKFLHNEKSITFSRFRKATGMDYGQTRETFAKLLAWNVIVMDYDGKNYYYAFRDQEKPGSRMLAWEIFQ